MTQEPQLQQFDFGLHSKMIRYLTPRGCILIYSINLDISILYRTCQKSCPIYIAFQCAIGCWLSAARGLDSLQLLMLGFLFDYLLHFSLALRFGSFFSASSSCSSCHRCPVYHTGHRFSSIFSIWT